eukprot:15446789-Alexandrium_andersonii.AAC.1
MDEVHYVVRVLPRYCFARVLTTLGLELDLHDFRDMVVRSVHASLAYMHMHVFDQLGRYPLRMCRGDLDHNIRQLAEMGLAA